MIYSGCVSLLEKKKYITIIVHLNVVLFDTGSPTLPLSNPIQTCGTPTKQVQAARHRAIRTLVRIYPPSSHKMGPPLPVINGVITPRSRLLLTIPVGHLFLAIYIGGPIAPLKTARGPPCFFGSGLKCRNESGSTNQIRGSALPNLRSY